MTIICVPVQTKKQQHTAFNLGADLVEYDFGSYKLLLGKDHKWIDRDFRSPLASDIVSYHNFDQMPEDLEKLLFQMRQKRGKFYKIAAKATSTLDALKMVAFTQKHPDVIGICMGDEGIVSRILGHAPLSYAALSDEERSAPGQLLLEEVLSLYKLRERRHPWYGLIGDPVSQSIGHLYHNPERLYVKMRLSPHLLPSFFHLYASFFSGLSVTRPLKEAVIPYLDQIDPTAGAIGAVNTIVFHQGKSHGFNTDGEGALEALGSVAGKKILILGTGGSARAIGYTALQKGATVSFLGRNKAKAETLASQFQCRFGFHPYDMLINTIPGLKKPFPCPILREATVMDIVFGPSELLKCAKESQCHCISADKMFIYQAKRQQALWDYFFLLSHAPINRLNLKYDSLRPWLGSSSTSTSNSTSTGAKI